MNDIVRDNGQYYLLKEGVCFSSHLNRHRSRLPGTKGKE